MRILCPIVLSQPLLVPRPQADIAESSRVGSQLVGHDDGRCKLVLLEERAHQLPGSTCVSPSLHQDVENLAFVVDGTPEIDPFPADEDDYLVEMLTEEGRGRCRRSRFANAGPNFRTQRRIVSYDTSSARSASNSSTSR